MKLHGKAQQFETTGTLAFRSDRPGRRIAGLAMEWDRVATSQGRRFRFPRGSLFWHDPVRVKLNLRHDWDRVVGFAESIEETSVGLEAVFRLARSTDADEALQLAEDHVLDGLSIEPEILRSSRDLVDPTVSVVERARLVGVALTAHPAMDGARVTAAAFSMAPGVVAGLRAQKAAWKGPEIVDHRTEHGFSVGPKPDRSFYA
jgi:HK97 family phage prohead protease